MFSLKIKFAVFVDGYRQATQTSLLSPKILQGQETVRVSLCICSHRKERVRYKFKTRTWVRYGISRRESFSGFFFFARKLVKLVFDKFYSILKEVLNKHAGNSCRNVQQSSNKLQIKYMNERNGEGGENSF